MRTANTRLHALRANHSPTPPSAKNHLFKSIPILKYTHLWALNESSGLGMFE